MIKTIYPSLTSFNIKKENNKDFIFDIIRKQWVKLTPEEWVRQNFIAFLLENHYPASLMSIEKEITLNDLKKRCDIIVYKKNIPWMIIECKEMNTTLTNKTIQQILSYNQSLNVHYLIVTNGTETFGIDTKTQKAIDELPNY